MVPGPSGSPFLPRTGLPSTDEGMQRAWCVAELSPYDTTAQAWILAGWVLLPGQFETFGVRSQLDGS